MVAYASRVVTMLIGCAEARGLQLYIYPCLAVGRKVRPGCDEQLLLRRYGHEVFSASSASFTGLGMILSFVDGNVIAACVEEPLCTI